MKKFEGVISFSDIAKTYENPQLQLSDICNKNCKYLMDGTNIYEQAKVIFSEYLSMQYIPVLDKEKNVVDLLSRDRVFWKQRYDAALLPRMHYAYCMWSAALEAKALGYDSFSVIEFGVCQGNGLVNCELHAKEIGRILNMNIEIYGFDSAEGLPYENMGYKDLAHIFPGGAYQMDREKLEKRLRSAKLVIGDIAKTVETFFDKYNPAPVGCMLIDVDYYSSTVSALKLLEQEKGEFLPRIQMYFDDIWPEFEFQGEYLAIKEFNSKHDDIKISPECMYYQDHRAGTKICHMFKHKYYNELVKTQWGVEFKQADYELKYNDYI